MTEPWMDGAGIESSRTTRARLALLLIVALVLPLAVVSLGSRPPTDTTIEIASAVVAPVDDVAAQTVADAQASSSSADQASTTGAEASSSSSSSDDPTTTPSTAPATSAAPSTSAPATTTAPTTTKQAVSAGLAPPTTAAAAATAAAPVYTAPPQTAAPAPVVTAAPSGSQSDYAFLACVRRRESGGNYAIVSSNGLYYGAYQFLRATWNGAAQIAGRPDLVGQAPNTVAPADQDAVALAFYRAVGSSPWGGACY